MERKDFFRKMAIGGSILLTAPFVLESCSKNDGSTDPDDTGTTNPGAVTIDLNGADFSALGTIGGYVYKNNILVFRTGEDTYLALSSVCTHSSCTVTYNHSTGNVPCPCHGSTFTTAGVVTNGPALTNLKRYTVKKEGDILTIT